MTAPDPDDVRRMSSAAEELAAGFRPMIEGVHQFVVDMQEWVKRAADVLNRGTGAHRRETPAMSAMHTAYRRRARRRGGAGRR